MRRLLVLVLLLTACGTTEAEPSSLVDRAPGRTVTIGVKFDEPGIAVRRPDGTFVGFEVDVARYVARQLGATDVVFKEARAAQREQLIIDGNVDLVVATYSITERRKLRIGFAGPHFVAGQKLLVRNGDTAIAGPESLDGRTLCSVTETTSATTIREKYAGEVRLVEYSNYTECVAALRSGGVDAVTTDDVILAGFASQHEGELRVVGEPFTVEYYGIGVRKADNRAVAAVASAIRRMQDDGTWRRSLETHVGPSGYPIPPAPAITEK